MSEPKAVPRLYSLNPDVIEKLKKLSAHAECNQSQYLRELIQSTYAAVFGKVQYGLIDDDTASN